MASVFYVEGKRQLLLNTARWANASGSIGPWIGLSSLASVSGTSFQFQSQVTFIGLQQLLSPTLIAGTSTVDAADATFPSVTGAVNSMFFYYNNNGTQWPLFLGIDGFANAGVNPGGGQVLVSFDPAGIFTL